MSKRLEMRMLIGQITKGFEQRAFILGDVGVIGGYFEFVRNAQHLGEDQPESGVGGRPVSVDVVALVGICRQVE